MSINNRERGLGIYYLVQYSQSSTRVRLHAPVNPLFKIQGPNSMSITFNVIFCNDLRTSVIVSRIYLNLDKQLYVSCVLTYVNNFLSESTCTMYNQAGHFPFTRANYADSMCELNETHQ